MDSDQRTRRLSEVPTVVPGKEELQAMQASDLDAPTADEGAAAVPAPSPAPEPMTLEEERPEPSRRRVTGAQQAMHAEPIAGRPSRLGWVLAGAFAVLLGTGWYFLYAPLSSQLDGAVAERDEALNANSELVRERDALQAEVQKARAQQAELAAQAAVNEQALQAMKNTQEELQTKLQAEIKKGNVEVTEDQGELIVDLIDKIVFDPGVSEINAAGLEVLRQVGETLKKVPDKLIQVSGHTDTTPISKNLIEKFPTNWELATARATNVVRFLREEIKIPGNRLAAVGYAEYQPVAKNSTTTGRRRNRRIEVRLVPLRTVRSR